MTDIHQKARFIRAKKLGVLLRDARQASGKSLEEVANALGITPDMLESYEFGDRSPSLPEVEMLAYTLDVPLEHFWSQKTHQNQNEDAEKNVNGASMVRLRQRMIGVLLRQARQDVHLSTEQLAEKAGMTSEDVEAYELGEKPIPIPVLETLANVLNRPLREFQDKHGPVGSWILQQHAMLGFKEMPAELQLFVTKPINRPYLELAQRLSEMEVEKLRAVAEGLLEITL